MTKKDIYSMKQNEEQERKKNIFIIGLKFE